MSSNDEAIAVPRMSSNNEAIAAPRVSSNDEVIAAPRYPGLMVLLIGVVVAAGLAAFGIWSRSDTVASSEAGRRTMRRSPVSS